MWTFAIGNAVALAGPSPAASLSSAEDPLFGLASLGNGKPDEPARWARNATGVYGADVDLSRLLAVSERADAPLGWWDFLNLVEGTPGLPALPPDFGDYGARNPALRFFRPSAQDAEAMPGEDFTLEGGLYLPSASDATAVRVRLIDLFTGRSYDGVGNEWTDGDVYVAEQTSTDAWLDYQEDIPADPLRVERTRYRVLLENDDAGGYDADSFCYASAYQGAGNPALYPDVGFVALFGHNIPAEATVTFAEAGGAGTPIALTPAVPTFFASATAQSFRTWRLSITMPAGSETYHERPWVGEFWAGPITTMEWCPAYPFDLSVEMPGQVRIDGGYGRIYVTAAAPRELQNPKLVFKTNGADGYLQIRRSLMQATRQGQDPLVLVPVAALEGALALHGIVGNTVNYSRKNNSRREFAIPFFESPFARVP